MNKREREDIEYQRGLVHHNAIIRLAARHRDEYEELFISEAKKVDRPELKPLEILVNG